MTEKDEKIKFYYPYCKENGCDGVLSVKFNNDFSIDYICDKNKKHQKKRIFFKTFERFYLQDKKIEKCSNCHCILESDKYKCLKCKKIFCCYCFNLDEHIKNNINNLLLTKKKCLIHKIDFTLYCIDCKKNLCVFCATDEIHTKDYHDIKSLYEFIPSENEIENVNHKIKKRKETYKELIQSLDEWEIKVHNKIEGLKKNLLYEIELMEKMFSNYNKFFLNYLYFKNFDYFKNYIERDNLKFDKCYSFSEFREILDELFEKKSTNENLFEEKELDLIEEFSIKNGIITKIDDKYFFNYCSNDKVGISFIDKNGELNTLKKTIIEFSINIHSVSVSFRKNKIYACLTNLRKVVMFNFDLENQLMEQNMNEITDEGENRFNKCIDIKDDLIVTGDNKYIIIWEKSNDFYIIKKKLLLDTKTNDLLLINDEYFVSSQVNKSTITFIDISNLKDDKVIKKIDSIDCYNCLCLLRNFLIVNCKEGIAIILLETKELIRYIQNYEDDFVKHSKRLTTYNNGKDFYVYILNQFDDSNIKYNILVMKLEDNNFKLIGKYEDSSTDDRNFNFLIMNENTILICGEKIYIYNELI